MILVDPKGIVAEIAGGRRACMRLQEIGIVKGNKIKVLRNVGSLLVSTNGAKFIIGRGLAMKVMVDDGEKIRRLP